MNSTEIIILLGLTAANVWFNWWISVREKRYHGIFRFICFECIIILVLFNYPLWFIDVLSPRQLVSWLLLALSVIVAGVGFALFYSRGKPEDRMEKTTELITSGIYRYIRHPLYLSLILAGFGAMMKDPGWLQIILSLLNLVALVITARVEEKEMISKFGLAYREYMKKSKMFFPYVF